MVFQDYKAIFWFPGVSFKETNQNPWQEELVESTQIDGLHMQGKGLRFDWNQ